MLDAAESVLQDPKAAESVVRSVGSVARTATGAFSGFAAGRWAPRSEEHTSELQSLMRISYAVFCLKKKKPIHNKISSQLQTHTNIHIIQTQQHTRHATHKFKRMYTYFH